MASSEDTQEFGGPASPEPVRPFQSTGTFRSLRHRNFKLYFGGQLISIAGTWMQIVAQSWLVYEISHSELTLGIVGFASAIPALLAAPWAGVVVDRLPKRSVLIITQAAAMFLALILAALAFTGRAQVWQVVALAAALGLVNAFDGPARQAFVVEMVGRDDLTNAIALNSMMFNGARVVGPALGGILLATVGSGWCFLINGLSYIAVIAGLAAMKLPPHIAIGTAAAPLREMARGLRYVLAHVEQFALLLLALIFSVFGVSYNTLLPSMADGMLHAGPQGYGLLNAATGVGAMAGALVIARTGGGGRRGLWLFAASVVFPIVLLVFGLVTNLAASLVLALSLGLLFMIQFTLINTLLQLRVADDMRGRVLSLYVLIWFGFSPFGNLAMGNLAEHWGLSLTIGLGAAVSMILALIVFALVPRLRRLL